MGDVRLETPLVTVLMADGQTLTVQVLNPDYLRWDRTSNKHGWPPMAKVPHTWLTFVAWAALRRTGQLGEDVTWERFSEELCLQVTNARGDDTNGSGAEEALAAMGITPEILSLAEVADGVDPTPTGPGPD